MSHLASYMESREVLSLSLMMMVPSMANLRSVRVVRTSVIIFKPKYEKKNVVSLTSMIYGLDLESK